MLRFALLFFSFWVSSLHALTYQQPDERLTQLVDAAGSVGWQLSASEKWLLQTETAAYPHLQMLPQDTVALAGLLINLPQLSAGLSRGFQRISIQHMLKATHYEWAASSGQRLFSPLLSPDENWLSVVVAQPDGLFIELMDLRNGKRKRMRQRLNAILGIQYQWLADSSALVAAIDPSSETPTRLAAPIEPEVRESSGKAAKLRTLQQLLQSDSDAAYFEQLIQSRLVRVSTRLSVKTIIEQPLYSFALSPDSQFVLTQQLARPYSFRVRYTHFPRQAGIYDLKGKKVADAGSLNLHESRKTRSGRRILSWQPQQAASLYWVEKSNDEASKDHIWSWSAPFSAAPQLLYSTAWRYSKLLWSDSGLAILYEKDEDTEQERTWLFSNGLTGTPQLWYQRNSKDRHALPGEPLLTTNRYLKRVLQLSKNGEFYIRGLDDKSMLARLAAVNPETQQQSLLWQSASDAEETPLQLLADETVLLTRQTVAQPPELYIQPKNGQQQQWVKRGHPAPDYAQVQQQWIEYQRSDGVKLSGRLYLPAGYKPADGPLPVLMWAYPREYASASLAEQRTVPEQRFSRFRPSGAQPYVGLGYAVFDQVTMPIISKDGALPNDDFLPQLVANAEAAVDVLVSMGVAERGNIAVAGHSYGAFMVANLLAHTDLFAAGIARSGAYNRSLTPFGFQSEKRSLWQDAVLYNKMSPFVYADRIDSPLLLIHGEADANSGTFPMQSERLFDALQGLGKHSRLVLLPLEGHHYQARESVLHVLWEQQSWLARYLKATPAMLALQ